MRSDLKDIEHVSFDNLFIDPNNPRISPEERPGYETPSAIFDEDVQAELNKAIESVYNVKDLQTSIIAQGWVPIDSIIVWEHHDTPGHYIVVEGNTRTVALRHIRSNMGREEEKLERMRSHPKKYGNRELREQEQLVERMQHVIADTENLAVYPVNADTPDELEKRLPRILGVRHIKHAQQWNPWATNLYMLSLYERDYEARYGSDEPLRIDSDLVRQVGELVSEGPTKTRRAIQAASAFSHFRARYEDQLTEGDEFAPADQYYFENILQNKYAQEQFSFGKDDLELIPEAEEALFQWAFRHPRGGSGEQHNVFRKAEDIRLWSRISRYDNEKGTAFASELNVDDPGSATPMAKLEAKYLAHKNRVTALDTMAGLLESLEQIPATTLLSQSSHLRPMLEEVSELVNNYLRMMDARAEPERSEAAGE